MKYQVVCKEGPAWGLYRIALGWAKALGCSVGKHPDLRADVNVWIGHSYFGHEAHHKRAGKFNAVLFTHRPDTKSGWDRAARYAQLCVCQSQRYAKHLPKKKTVVLHPGFHPSFDIGEKMRFLVMMATHNSKSGKPIKRKRLDWYEQLHKMENSEWMITAGKYPFEELPRLIDWCDYLVILSDMEGGPLVLHEALARHKPVVAPDVGYCWEWPVVRYTGFTELENIIRRLCAACDYEQEGDAAQGRMLKYIVDKELRHG